MTFQTSALATPPDATKIATDDVGGSHHQRVKVDLGGDGVSSPLVRGQQADANSIPVTLSTEQAAFINGLETLLGAIQTAVEAVQASVAGTLAVSNGGLTELAAAINASSQMDVNLAASNATVTVTATNLDVQSGGADLATSTQAGAIQTAVELIDDTVKAEDVASQADDKGVVVMAIRDDTLNARSGTEGDYEFLHTDANGGLWTQDVNSAAAAASLSVIDDWDESDRAKVNLVVGQAGITGGSGGAASNSPRIIMATDSPDVTALQLIDDGVYTDDTSTHSTGTSKGYGIMAAATPTDGSVNANDFGHLAMTVDRKLHVAVMDALPAGTAAIGKLAANSGVDIGDVDVTSIAAGTNLIGDVGLQPRTTNGLDTFMASGSDGSSILVATAQVIKASAGKLYGYYAYNPEAAVTFVHFYNTAAASVTVGTTNPLFTLAIPPGSAANLATEMGITFSNAGWSCAATTTAGGNTAPATGVSLVAWYK